MNGTVRFLDFGGGVCIIVTCTLFARYGTLCEQSGSLCEQYGSFCERYGSLLARYGTVLFLGVVARFRVCTCIKNGSTDGSSDFN